MSEFDLIERYFTWKSNKQNSNNGIVKSVGDDAAVLSLAENKQIVTSIDTLISGVHFPVETSADDIGYKSLAVNLSDLAAMGAKPEWFTLALTLPEIDYEWLDQFSSGLKNLAERSEITLVGGDTTSGPLAISIQVIGSVDVDKAIYRSGAKLGDKIYVTGTLGDGKAGLLSVQGQLNLSNEHAEYCENRLNRPTARINESELIKGFASSCIDVSDGLLQDLSHILKQSNLKISQQNHDKNTLGAEIGLSHIPLSAALKSLDADQAIGFALSGGDDYELLFTIPESLESTFLERNTDYAFTCIGTITHDEGIVDTNKKPLYGKGFNHFSEMLSS